MINAKAGLLAVSIAMVLAARGSGQQRVLVLEGGTLIDGTGRPPVQDAVVVIEGNRIARVGVRGQVVYPSTARVVGVAGRTICRA